MTLTQIKQQLSITGINFSRCKDKDGQPTEFLRHWDAKQRFSLVAHQDVVARIKADSNCNKLALKWEQRVTKEVADANGEVNATAGLSYDSYILIYSENIEESL
jgi:hypothetical protein